MKKYSKIKKNKVKVTPLAFTLIELLGVIIILAIIALISTPIIINIINETQESSDMITAELIVDSAHNYYAESLLDESKKENIGTGKDIYNELVIMNKPEVGNVYVSETDQVAMAIMINNKCYIKRYESEIEIVGVSECDLGYMGPDDIKPTISQKVVNTSMNENGWYKEDIYIEVEVIDSESGPKGYKRCMSSSVCDPDETIYSVENKILINTESETNYVCIIGLDNRGNESEKNCVSYKLDKTNPDILVSAIPQENDQIFVTMSCSDDISEVNNYYFSIDGGLNFINNGSSNTYLFDNLNSGINYSIAAKCDNKSGLESNYSTDISTNYCWKEQSIRYIYMLEGWEEVSSGTAGSFTTSGNTSFDLDSNTGEITFSGYQNKITYTSGTNATYEFYYKIDDNTLGARVIKTTPTKLTYTTYRNTIKKDYLVIGDTITTYSLSDWEVVDSGTAGSFTTSGNTSFDLDSNTGEITFSGYQNKITYTSGTNATYEFYYKIDDNTLGARVIKTTPTKLTYTTYRASIIKTEMPNTGYITIYSLSDWEVVDSGTAGSFTTSGNTSFDLDSNTGEITFSGYQNQITYTSGTNATYEFYYKIDDNTLGARVIKTTPTKLTYTTYKTTVLSETKELMGSNIVCSNDQNKYPNGDLKDEYYYELVE